MHPALSTLETFVRRRWRACALAVVGTVAIAAGCSSPTQVVTIDIPRMTPNPAAIGTRSVISVIVLNRIGCSLASVKVTFGSTVVSMQQVDVGTAYKDSVVVTAAGPVVAVATCGNAVDTKSDILGAF